MTLNELVERLQDMHSRFGGEIEVRLTTAMQWPTVCRNSVQLMENEVAGLLVSTEEGGLGAPRMFPEGTDANSVHIVVGSQLQCGTTENWGVIDQNISLSEGE